MKHHVRYRQAVSGGIVLLSLILLPCCKGHHRPVTIGIAQWIANPEYERNIAGFKDELAAHGFKEGVSVYYITVVAQADKLKQRQAIELFRNRKVDLIYSLTTPGTLIAKKYADHIPVVFSIVTYPVEAGVIQSLESSECNAVGTRNYVAPARQFYTFGRLVPNVKSIAFVHRSGEPNSTIQFNEFRTILEQRGIRLIEVAAADTADIRRQLEALCGTIDAVYAACDTLVQCGGEEIIISFCRTNRLPSFTCNDDGVRKGALVGNVADLYSIGQVSGEKAVLILGGADPQWLHTEAPREEHILVNQETARRLGITITADILERATMLRSSAQ